MKEVIERQERELKDVNDELTDVNNKLKEVNAELTGVNTELKEMKAHIAKLMQSAASSNH